MTSPFVQNTPLSLRDPGLAGLQNSVIRKAIKVYSFPPLFFCGSFTVSPAPILLMRVKPWSEKLPSEHWECIVYSTSYDPQSDNRNLTPIRKLRRRRCRSSSTRFLILLLYRRPSFLHWWIYCVCLVEVPSKYRYSCEISLTFLEFGGLGRGRGGWKSETFDCQPYSRHGSFVDLCATLIPKDTLYEYMRDPDIILRRLAIEGFTKLLYFNKIHDRRVRSCFVNSFLLR